MVGSISTGSEYVGRHPKQINYPQKSPDISHKLLSQKVKTLEKEIIELGIDRITGLPTSNEFRRAFDNAQESNSIVVITVLDCNNLKTINDTKGHPVGNKYLKDTADFIKSIHKASDFSARIGGDEFAILQTINLDNFYEEYEKYVKTFDFTDESFDPATINAEKLTKEEFFAATTETEIVQNIYDSLERYNQRNPNNQISFSFGVASSFPKFNQKPLHKLHETFDSADRRLYMMKHLYHYQNPVKK